MKLFSKILLNNFIQFISYEFLNWKIQNFLCFFSGFKRFSTCINQPGPITIGRTLWLKYSFYFKIFLKLSSNNFDEEKSILECRLVGAGFQQVVVVKDRKKRCECKFITFFFHYFLHNYLRIYLINH